MYKNSTISLIVPCYNEAPRIAKVLNPAIKSKYLDEIIVIDDASTDNSVSVILNFDGKVKLLRHRKNTGKADAIFNGIKDAKSTFIFMLDADLQGLKTKHIDETIEQAIDLDLDMLLMPVDSPIILRDIANTIGTNIVVTGQRVIRKDKILPFLNKRRLGFGLEMYINNLAEAKHWKTDVILWKKMSLPKTTLKIEKYGFIKGIRGEFKMLSQVRKVSTLVDYLLHYKKFVIRKSRKPDWFKLLSNEGR